MEVRPTYLSLTLLLLCGGSLLTGCSGLFFYPDQAVYLTPDRLNLRYEDVYLDTADAETLHGWWLPSSNGTTKGTVYYLHGNAQNISSHILNVAWLPERGYNVFMIDYRGFGGSTGAPDLEGALHDAETGLRWLAANPEASGSPIMLLGQSLGGALGAALAGKWTETQAQPALDAVVLDAAFSGFRTIAQEKLDSFWLTWALQVPLSWTIPDDHEALDLIAAVAPTPLLIIHSTRDAIVPFHHGTTLFTKAQQPKQFLQTDTPHAATFVYPEYREEVIEFLEAE